jgi:crotonobetaine/carnitine-CoA ligase
MNRASLSQREDRVLGRVLRAQAEKIPDAPFLLAGDERYSYGRANELANRYAAGLAGLGVARGDTVALLMETCPEFALTSFAANKLGAVWVPTNVDYKGAWLRQTLEDSRARVLVADAALLPRVAELGAGLPFERVVVRGAADGQALGIPLQPLAEFAELPAAEPDPAELSYGDTAAVLWTSGTTGRSKGVMQSHNAWLRGAESGARNSGVRAGDVLYCCLPMYNSAAWVACVYRALVSGIPVGIDARFSASDFWERCRHYGATMTFTLGAMHIFLWQAPARPDDADHPVRAASMVPLPDELIEPMKQRFGLESIDQGYGQSEVMGLFSRSSDAARSWKPRSLGDPLDGLEVALLDDDDLPVPEGQVGELCVRPTEPYVIFNGYFHQPEATLRAWRNLWYHTGDLGRCDEDGDWFFVDRKADYIRFKGRNISSFAVEAAVAAHPAVKECAAHGVTSAELESEAELKVVVVLHDGQTLEAEALARFVNDNAPHFFVPRYIEFTDELPHTPTGRVQKYRLRERGVTPATWDRHASDFEVVR